MKWNELTLWQYQQLMPTITNPDKDWTELDTEVKQLCIVTGLTEHQIDKLFQIKMKYLLFQEY